jgi:multidrug resistance efflux pump
MPPPPALDFITAAAAAPDFTPSHQSHLEAAGAPLAERVQAEQEALAGEETALLDQTRELRRQRDNALAALEDLRASTDEIEEQLQQTREQQAAAETQRNAAVEHLEKLHADTSHARSEAEKLTQQATEAQAAYESARERLRGVKQQNAQLENDRIRTLAEIKATKAQMRDAQEEAEKLARLSPADGGRGRKRVGAAVVAAAFAVTAGVLYVVPRYFPQQTVPAPASPVVAAAPAAHSSPIAAAPLYADDRNARRDLNLSYELQQPAPAKR